MNDDYPGTCLGFTTANSTGLGTGSFQTTGQSICDGSGWSDQRQLAQWRCGIDEREIRGNGPLGRL